MEDRTSLANAYAGANHHHVARTATKAAAEAVAHFVVEGRMRPIMQRCFYRGAIPLASATVTSLL